LGTEAYRKQVESYDDIVKRSSYSDSDSMAGAHNWIGKSFRPPPESMFVGLCTEFCATWELVSRMRSYNLGSTWHKNFLHLQNTITNLIKII